MRYLPRARFAARVWFAMNLIMALALIFSTYNAQAQNEPRTQTQTGGPGTPGERPPNSIVDQSVRTSGAITTNISQQIQERAEREGQWIQGRQVEVENLEDGLVISESRTVILEGDGKTGVLEEYLRQNPQDLAFSINNDYLVNLNEADSVTQLKAELNRLAQLAGEAQASGAKVILHIPDLKLLMKGAIITPLDAVWDRIGANKNLHFVIESTPAVTEEAFKRAKLPEIRNRIVRQTVLPGSLEAVTDYAYRVAQEIERQRGIRFTADGIESAARLSVRKLGETANLNLNTTGVFHRVAKLLNQAATVLQRRQKSGQSGAAESKAEIRRLENLERVLAQDLADEPGNTELEKRLKDVRAKLETARLASENSTAPSNLSQKLAGVELKLTQANMIVEAEQKARSRISVSKTSAHKQAEADVRRLTEEKLRIESEMALGQDQGDKPAKRVGKQLVLETAAHWLGAKVESLEANFESGIRNLENIKKTVFGQDHVIESIRRALVLRATNLQEGKPVKTQEQADAIRMGVADDHARPLGSFWFGGETGVGKTETTVQLAQEIGFHYHRFDMSEFMQEHMVAQFIGSPQGYVGYGENGGLIDLLEKFPESVIVFDEIEKAHPKVQTILLQLLEYGEITSGDGKKRVSAKRAIIVMTSNAGQRISGWNRKQLVEFLADKGEGRPGWSVEEIRNKTNMDIDRLRSEVYKLYVKNPSLMAAEGLHALRPELVGRMDEVTVFNRLTPDIIMKITQKSIRDLALRMKYFHKIQLRLTSKAFANLAGLYNDTEGARSMRRGVDRMLRMPIADGIINKAVGPGDSIVVDVDEKGQFSAKVNTAAELESVLGTEPSKPTPADEMRAKIEARKRPAFAQTMELVRRVVSPELLIGEHAFTRFRKR